MVVHCVVVGLLVLAVVDVHVEVVVDVGHGWSEMLGQQILI